MTRIERDTPSEKAEASREARCLVQARLRVGLTQAKAAKLLGVSPPLVSMWESGTRDPGTAQLLAMSRLYGCSVDALLLSTSPDTETRGDCTCSPSAFTGYYTPANDCPAHGPASAPPASEGEAQSDEYCKNCGWVDCLCKSARDPAPVEGEAREWTLLVCDVCGDVWAIDNAVVDQDCECCLDQASDREAIGKLRETRVREVPAPTEARAEGEAG